jgi:hypothetical protein
MPRNAALIQGPYKIVIGTQWGFGVSVGPNFPNGTIPKPDPGCPDGCLFDILADPGETTDIKEKNPSQFTAMLERVKQIGLGVYQVMCVTFLVSHLATGFARVLMPWAIPLHPQTDYSNIPDDADCISPAAGFAKYKGWLGPLCGPLPPH